MPPFKKKASWPRSIKKTLLIWVLPTLIIGNILSLVFSIDLLDEQAESAFDRTLAGVLQAIDANISTPNGGLALEEPYRLLEFFQLTATGNAYYHVATEDGLAEIGFYPLPRPTKTLQENTITFSTGLYFAEQPVRVATLLRRSNPEDPTSPRLIVQVGESLEERKEFSTRLIWRSIQRDIFAMVLTTAILVIGIMVALLPLKHVQQRLAKRKDHDLRPINTTDLPNELVPLVAAINKQTQRVLEQNEQQRQFLHDASHQLRTPLSILKTQVSFSLREKDPTEIHKALCSMEKTIRRATRVTNQLLNLARAQHTAQSQQATEQEPLELRQTIQQCIDWLELPAINKNIDIDFQYDPSESWIIQGIPLLLQEAILNIIDNALQYSPNNTTIHITLFKNLNQHFVIRIEDEGAGMNQHDLEQAGLRFRRGQTGKNHQGAGLGLAIVKSIMGLHHGQLLLAQSNQYSGLCVSLVFTLDNAIS